jgi:hypothetical protein
MSLGGDYIDRVERWYTPTPLAVPVAPMGGDERELPPGPLPSSPARVVVDWDRLGVLGAQLFVFGTMAFTVGVTAWLLFG